MTCENLFYVSDDEEVWSVHEEFTSREDAIDWGMQEYEAGQLFWTGVKGTPPSPIIDADDLERLFENLTERMEPPEGADPWPDIPETDIAELAAQVTRLLHALLDKHKAWPSWFPIEKVQSHRVPTEVRP